MVSNCVDNFQRIARGKCIITKKWVYGYLMLNATGRLSIQEIKEPETGKMQVKFMPVGVTVVDPKTIGFYTGLKILKHRIFSGDIVETDGSYPIPYKGSDAGARRVIYFGSTGFYGVRQSFPMDKENPDSAFSWDGKTLFKMWKSLKFKGTIHD